MTYPPHPNLFSGTYCARQSQHARALVSTSLVPKSWLDKPKSKDQGKSQQPSGLRASLAHTVPSAAVRTPWEPRAARWLPFLERPLGVCRDAGRSGCKRVKLPQGKHRQLAARQARQLLQSNPHALQTKEIQTKQKSSTASANPRLMNT